MACKKQTAVNALLKLSLALSVGYAASYPVIWTGITQDCQAVPAASYGPHASPVPDGNSLMTVKRLSSTVLRMCPGMPHKLQIAFPEPRQYVVTSNQGTFSTPSANCPNRASSTSATQNVDLSLTLGCDAAGSVRVQMVSVASPGAKQYKLFTTTLPINSLDSCPQSPCHIGAPTPESGSVPAVKEQPVPVIKEQPVTAADLAAVPVPAAAEPAAPAPAAPSGPVEIDLMDLLRLPGQRNGNNKGLLGGLNLLGGMGGSGAAAAAPADAAAAPTDAGAAAALPGIPQIHPLQMAQQLGNVNATAVLSVLKTLGKMVDGQGDSQDGAPRFNLESVMQFMQTVGQVMPNAATAQSSAAPDLPTAVLNVLKSMGKLLPSDKPVDVMAVVGFVKSVSELFGKLSAMRAG